MAEEKKVKEPIKRAKKPAQPKPRTIEETIDLVETKLTEKEKIALIKYLKEVVTSAETKVSQLETSFEGMCAKHNNLKNEFNEMERYYQDSLKYISEQSRAFVSAISRATFGGK